MAVSISQPPYFKNLLAIAATQATGASAAFSIPFADAYTFYLNVTTAGQTTMDTVFQTSVDKGTTFVNVPWRFAQVTTTTGCFVLNVHSGIGPANGPVGTITTGEGGLTAATGGVLSLGAIVDPQNMKFFMTVSGTAPVSTLYVAAWSRGVTDANAA
jgi:hypothetical protein